VTRQQFTSKWTYSTICSKLSLRGKRCADFKILIKCQWWSRL